jgi:hypothetical protein
MVLLEVHSGSVRRLPFEGDCPRTVHVNAAPQRLPSELMQIESRKVELRQCRCSVECIETTLAFCLKRRSDQPGFVGFEQLSKPLCRKLRITLEV